MTVWGAQGENVAKYLQKGSPLLIDGRLEWREWQAQDGTNRQSVEIIAENTQFIGGRDGGGGGERGGGGGASSRPAPTAACSRFRPQTTTTFRSRPCLEHETRRTGLRRWLHPAAKTTKRKRGPGTGAGGKKKICHFCKDKVEEVDYKNANTLRRYVSEKGKIRSRRITGACRRHQRQVAVAVKRAREVALLPYVAG